MKMNWTVVFALGRKTSCGLLHGTMRVPSTTMRHCELFDFDLLFRCGDSSESQVLSTLGTRVYCASPSPLPLPHRSTVVRSVLTNLIFSKWRFLTSWRLKASDRHRLFALNIRITRIVSFSPKWVSFPSVNWLWMLFPMLAFQNWKNVSLSPTTFNFPFCSKWEMHTVILGAFSFVCSAQWTNWVKGLCGGVGKENYASRAKWTEIDRQLAVNKTG